MQTFFLHQASLPAPPTLSDNKAAVDAHPRTGPVKLPPPRFLFNIPYSVYSVRCRACIPCCAEQLRDRQQQIISRSRHLPRAWCKLNQLRFQDCLAAPPSGLPPMGIQQGPYYAAAAVHALSMPSSPVLTNAALLGEWETQWTGAECPKHRLGCSSVRRHTVR